MPKYFHAVQLGDKIVAPTLFRGQGVVLKIEDYYPTKITVVAPNGTHFYFTLDGVAGGATEQAAFYCDENGRKLAARPVKLELVEVERWANVYPGGKLRIHKTKEIADKKACPSRISCILLSGAYMISK